MYALRDLNNNEKYLHYSALDMKYTDIVFRCHNIDIIPSSTALLLIKNSEDYNTFKINQHV